MLVNALYMKQAWKAILGSAGAHKFQGLRFKSYADQIRHSVANDSLGLRHFFEAAFLGRKGNDEPHKLVTRRGVLEVLYTLYSNID